MPGLKLIAGLGNPGAEYALTRHNAGVWFVEQLAESLGGQFRDEKKFFGRVATCRLGDRELRLLVPQTFMNHSGKSVGACAHFYKIHPKQIMIAHDEIDLPIGTIRFKQGGGLAGHNGLRDITRALAGTQDYSRLRIGVGHPGGKAGVINHVLGKATASDRDIIQQCLDEALACMPLAAEGEWEKAMNRLHNFKIPLQG